MRSWNRRDLPSPQIADEGTEGPHLPQDAEMEMEMSEVQQISDAAAEAALVGWHAKIPAG
jgi:hypothetical protein